MPIKETLKRPLERSNYLHVNWPQESHYGREGSPACGKTKTPASSISPNRIVISYDNMFVQNPHSKRNESFSNGHGSGGLHNPCFLANRNDSLSMVSEESLRTPRITSRLAGGTNRIQPEVNKLVLSPSLCKLKPTGLGYFDGKTNLGLVSLQMMGADNTSANRTNFQYLPTPQSRRLMKLPKTTRTRGTQSLYRVSSAQTLPYLPAVSNDPDELESMELFKLPTILPGDGPPGLYEVEVLERARKRWAFAKALKDNFRKQLAESHPEAKLPQHKDILEAFEWEHWIEREEYIQDCQMLRLEILIDMFDKREKQMRSDSQRRIQQSLSDIAAKRKAALRKSEIEFGRELRRLELQHSKEPRTWRKEHMSQGLGDPTSEFCAPKMRYGVDPSRRHYTTARKSFDLHMDELERKTIHMQPGDLKCPLAKLRQWSKPKAIVQEVEQNFCAEDNLKKLYQSLRTLRETTDRPKATPLCLKSRDMPTTIPEEPITAPSARVTIHDEVAAYEYQNEDCTSEDSDKRRLRAEHDYQEYLQELRQEKQAERQLREHLHNEMRHEEFETLVQSYEGNTIGWLMRFLAEEMSRLQEQRNLHACAMLAKRERSQREAAEAGLRQKENCMRETYEKLYLECEEANVEMAEKYTRQILDDDIKDYAHQQAEEYVAKKGKDLDKEINEWLEACRVVQNPLNYDNLRYALRDMVIPDVEKILYRLERDDCVEYIINAVLLPTVYQQLEAYDISFSVANDFVDRLIDNDLHLDSTDCSSDGECLEFGSCSKARQEAMAILRKLIRHSVPGRRWLTPSERVADENLKDIVDEVVDGSIIHTDKPMAEVVENFSYIDLTAPKREVYFTDVSEEETLRSHDNCKMNRLGDKPTMPTRHRTKSLQYSEQLLLADTDHISADKFTIHMDEYECPRPQQPPSIVHRTPSTHDLTSVWNFAKTPTYCRTSSDEIPFEEDDFMERFLVQPPLQRFGEEAFDEVRERIESWTVETSSSHGDFEEENEKEQLEVNGIEVPQEFEEVVEEQKMIDSRVHFDVNPLVIEEIIQREPLTPDNDDDDDDVGGVIPVAFSYDPTVKFTVPVPSSYEMVDSHKETQKTITEQKVEDDKEDEKDNENK